ncbi:MAG: 50S ribosomal protein L19 [Patescibacteria group bacterium]
MIAQIDFAPGDIVKVFEKIKDGEKTRTQVFEGTVLGIRGRGKNKSFRVRKLVRDVLVERIWPFISPNIEKVVVKEHPKKKVKRAKLYYLFNTK